MTKMLDTAKAMIKGEAPQAPAGRLIGFNLVSIEPASAVIEFEATEAHRNPMGTLHGGILCDIADAAMGMAYASNLNEGESFTTLELKINFLSRSGTLVCEQRVTWSNKGAPSAWWNAT